MSWKGVQGGKPEGEERMRGSALSSPMGVPLDSFHEYKKKGENPFPLPIPHYPRALAIKMVIKNPRADD